MPVLIYSAVLIHIWFSPTQPIIPYPALHTSSICSSISTFPTRLDSTRNCCILRIAAHLDIYGEGHISLIGVEERFPVECACYLGWSSIQNIGSSWGICSISGSASYPAFPSIRRYCSKLNACTVVFFLSCY